MLHVGVSVSENPVAVLEKAMRLEGLSVVQVALNVFDTQLVRSGILAELQRRGIAVFARSAFLKGLIALAEERVPAAMAAVLPAKRRLRARAAARGRDILEFALQYPLSLPPVDCVLVGCETLAQLEQNLAWASAPRLTDDDLAAVADLATDLPAWITKPWLWPVEKWQS